MGFRLFRPQRSCKVGDIHLLLCDLVMRAHMKVSRLEIEKTKLDEKLIGF